ncbi:glycosyltransferase family 39 protein [Paenibacillus sp. PR3]|uniref:Glycosyltransferase family 39 protein n=1 Tax=Paenibacillus terricola TaxID=2763503 RepID=A0ABR8N2J4_9BACL|nr:glycosyltransferase family 39 protein [Paenibacillus terricola]MBD3921637.1 glycosyltransferase family 39 protein [Paenibacillus terricola]
MFTLKDTPIAMRRTLHGIAIAVLLISAIIVLAYGNYFLLGDLQKPNNDDVKYVRSAQILLEQGTLAYNSGTSPTLFIMPGIVLILSGFMWLFGHDGGMIAFRLFQCLQQAASIYLVFFIVRYMFNQRAAIIACVISALYWPDYFSSGEILTETTFKTIVLLLICATIAAIERRRWGMYAVVGVLVAAAAYFKPHASLYPAIFLLLWLKRKYTFKQMVQFGAVMAGAYIVLLLPWWIRNLITFDRFVLFTNSAGSPFLLGTRILGAMPPAGFFEAHPEYSPETVFQGSDSTAIHKGLDIIRYGFTHEPLRYSYWFTLGKMAELYLNPYYWRPVWPIGRDAMKWIQQALVTVSLVGLVWAMIRRPIERQLPVLLTLLYFTAIYLPFVAFSRYGYPNMVLITLFAAFLIERIYTFVSSRLRNRQAANGRQQSLHKGETV